MDSPKSVRLVLPLPPSSNGIWRISGKRNYLSPAYVEFKKEVGRIWKAAGSPYLNGRLEFSILLYFPNKRKSDISNRIKACEDALKGLLFEDDSQIDIGYQRRAGIQYPGGCIVVVKEIA